MRNACLPKQKETWRTDDSSERMIARILQEHKYYLQVNRVLAWLVLRLLSVARVRDFGNSGRRAGLESNLCNLKANQKLLNKTQERNTYTSQSKSLRIHLYTSQHSPNEIPILVSLSHLRISKYYTSRFKSFAHTRVQLVPKQT
mmetsp:Transcript_11372/g.24549  ORF Transcript_11372/g.24549 Transcript_11372/m.24549 type:complete len:144 (+) Transcript_11372:773-1204(+)